MIKASDIIKLVKIQLSNWNISRDEDALYQYLNMGLSDLGEKFNLYWKIETVQIIPEQAMYQLKNEDVNLVVDIYNEQGEQLNCSDVIDSMEWDYKLINHKTFLINNPKRVDGLLYVLYKASHIEVNCENDILDIPNVFKEVLMLYMMYLGTATIRSDASKDQNGWDTRNNFLQLYTQKAQELVMNGYKMNLGIESMPIIMKGYR